MVKGLKMKIYTFTKRNNPVTNNECFFYETNIEIQEWELGFYSNYTTIKPNLERLQDSYIIFDKSLNSWVYQSFKQEETKSDESVAKEDTKEELIEDKPKKTRKKG